MTETKPSVATSDLGVVDPIRVPGAARARRLWSGLPGLAQVFVALVAVDIAIRTVGLFGTSLFLDLGSPITWLTAFLPHDALVLLPAVLLWRSPGALTDLPLLLRGAMTIALVELLKDPVRGVVAGTGAGLEVLPIVLVGFVAAIATGVAWAAIGRELRALAPAKPWDSSALLANLVGGAIAIAAVASAASALLFGELDLGDSVATLIVRVTGALAALSGLGFAYLAWIVVRGTDDPARPAIATRLGAVSVSAIAIGTFLSLVAGAGIFWILLLVVAYVGGYTGLVVAFGLGLADPSGTIDRAVPTHDPAREQPGHDWPATA